MKKKHLVSGLAILGVGAAAAAVVVAKKLAKENTEPEDAILLDLDGDGVADVVLEDLDGDGKIDSVTASVQPQSEPTESAPEAVSEEEAQATSEDVTTENPDLITTIPAAEPAPNAEAPTQESAPDAKEAEVPTQAPTQEPQA